MDAVQSEVEQLRFALAGARSRIEELAANGRRIVSLEEQIAGIRSELERYQRANGDAANIVSGAREKRRKILEDAATLAQEVAQRAREINLTAEADADVLRAASLEEGRRRATEVLTKARSEAQEIRAAARREAELLKSEAEATVRTVLDDLARLRPATNRPTQPSVIRLSEHEPASPQTFRARRPTTLPRLGIEEADIWAKATRQPT